MIHHQTSKPLFNFNYKKEGEYKKGYHSHYSKYEIFFLHEGICEYVVGNEIYILRPGDMLLLHGMTLHGPVPNQQNKYIRTTAHFNYSYIYNLLNYKIMPDAIMPIQKLSNLLIHFKETDRIELEAILQRMNILYLQQNESAQARFTITFLELLQFIYPFYPNLKLDDLSQTSVKEQYAKQMIGYIEQHYKEEVNMKHLRDVLHLTENYLSKIFKEVTGMTVSNYLKKYRLNHARLSLITNQDLTISDIGYNVGFKQVSYFSRLFKEEFKHSPENYRRLFSQKHE